MRVKKVYLILLTAFLSTKNVDCFMERRHLGAHRLPELKHFRTYSLLSSEEVRLRLQERLAVLREKDRRSKYMSEQDLNVCYEDPHIIVVDKPAGILSVPSEYGVPSLSQAVYDRLRNEVNDFGGDRVKSMNQMVVHRLGADTSGLIVFAKTMEAVRGMNALFRERKITRQYEVLVAGHVEKNHGLVNLPLMRCYEYPPYMRISTEDHQQKLLSFEPSIVGKKLLEGPKASLTHFKVMERQYYKDNELLPVTRMTLTSMTGRTHQLNVHCAAIGHPIVLDNVYGWNGTAASNGGLSASDLPPDKASAELQQAITEAAFKEDCMCVHSKLIRFRHPAVDREVEFSSLAPF